MKKGLTISLLVSMLLLAGCQSGEEPEASPNENTSTASTSLVESETVESTSQSTTENTTSSNTTESTSSSSEVEERLWDTDKAQSLDTFMTDWGETMDQEYKEYSQGNNVDWYGEQIPDELVGEKKDWNTVLEEEPIDFEWSENGEASEDAYALVAVYSDADTQEYPDQHLYFFAIYDGEPKVLISQQTQGNAENNFYFSETDNEELQDGFSDIVNDDRI
ncbi:DUF4767 domain-containing protein [Tetragenococcus koreensis]|uniref:DUF4767 domain-containing protein n=1 Tax=Tetragenococcus koreensis TaxID=290335 RepID=A0AAN4RJS4_9ENTE|nr:DUF4767 domain-containing protein [Tetragenococcus koreensis]MCF1585687.1 DUF4767 domain-containing protein [Tetragenococcus koreensis]MCF1615320.1 DUF4767 domain-containing protein [Tetragenococcus koreensis]MCF1618680.1 DUF4767 domain-containing protein [Tetragenococcus koreensis]MCF1625123.1 DUF4767 domain-containing protein [Tetragenococcus koreensis]MCF1626293.1 DUF4767 domain-containing protein [Tetragenococcus koreensis]